MTLPQCEPLPSALYDERSLSHHVAGTDKSSTVLQSFSMSSFAPLTIDAKAAAASSADSAYQPASFTALDIAEPLPHTPSAVDHFWSSGRLSWLSSATVHHCVVVSFVLISILLAVLLQVLADGSSAALLAFSIVFPLVMIAFAAFSLLSFRHLSRHAASTPTASAALTALPSATASQYKQQTLSVLGFFLDRLNNPLHQILSQLQFLQDTQKPAQSQHPQQQQARTAEEEEIVCSIREQALIMQSIITDALDLRDLDPAALPPAASHSPTLPLPSTSLHWPSLLSVLLVPQQQQAAGRQVGVSSAVEAGLGVVYGDSRRVQQCVSLLVSSVIGLTNEGGNVCVRVKAVQPREEKAEAKQECDVCSRSSSGLRHSASLRGINLSCPTPSPHSKLRRVLRIETDQSKMALASSPSSLPRRLLTNQQPSSSATASTPSSFSSSAMKGSVPPLTAATAPLTSQPRPTTIVITQVKVVTSTLIGRQQLTQLLHPSHTQHHHITTSLHTPTPLTDTAPHSLPLVARLSQLLGGSLEVRCDGVRGTAFVLYVPCALTPPLGEEVEVAREMLLSPLPSQLGDAGGAEESSEHEYAVLLRSNDDKGVAVEALAHTQHSVSSHHTSAEDMTLASPLVRAHTTPLNAVRRMKADESSAAAQTADKAEAEDQSEMDDCKSIEPTTVNQSMVSSAGTLPSLPLLSFSPFTHAEHTPLSAFRASQTPSSSPSSALSSMSSMSMSAFQLNTPSYQLGRSFTEVATSSSSSTSSHSSFSLPATHRNSIPCHTTAVISSPASSATSVLAGSSSSAVPHHYTPVSTASASHSRRRSSNGMSSEMILMARQVAEARQKVRQSDGALYSGSQVVEEQPLSLLAGPRRLVDRIPTLDMADGGSELIGRAISAPGYSVQQQQRQLWQPSEANGSDTSSTPSSPLPLPHERVLTTVRSHTTTTIRATNAPSTSPGPTRAVGQHITTQPVIPANYALQSPQPNLSAVLSFSSSSSVAASAHQSFFTTNSSTTQPTTTPNTPHTAHIPASYSATPPLVPRQRIASSRRSPDEDKRVDALRAQLLALSVLVVDDSDINLKIALRMLQGIECDTATDGQQAVNVWRRRVGLDVQVSAMAVSSEEKRGSPQLSATTSPSLSAPPPIGALRSQSASTTSTPTTPHSTPPTPTTTATAQPPFSLVLMDIVMPVSGLDATRAIRTLERQHRLPHTPIIAVTANCTRSDRREAKAAGMDYLLAKPFTRQQLFEVMLLAMKEQGAASGGAAAGESKAVEVVGGSSNEVVGSKRL